MIPGTVISKQDFKDRLLAAWDTKRALLYRPYHYRTLVKVGASGERLELAFLLREHPDEAHPLVLRFKYSTGRLEASRDELVVEFGEWKRLPDIESACVEIDTFIADFECGH